MQQSLIVFDFLFPSGQYSSKTVHPAMSSLHYPSAGFEIGIPAGIGLFFSRLNVGFITSAFQIISQPFGVVTLVQTKNDPPAGSSRLKCIKRISNQPYVMDICSRDNKRKWKPVCIGHETAFYPLFSPVCRVFAGFFVPAKGDLVRQPSSDNHDQSITFRCSQTSKPFCQKRSKTPASHHS